MRLLKILNLVLACVAVTAGPGSATVYQYDYTGQTLYSTGFDGDKYTDPPDLYTAEPMVFTLIIDTAQLPLGLSDNTRLHISTDHCYALPRCVYRYTHESKESSGPRVSGSGVPLRPYIQLDAFAAIGLTFKEREVKPFSYLSIFGEIVAYMEWSGDIDLTFDENGILEAWQFSSLQGGTNDFIASNLGERNEYFYTKGPGVLKVSVVPLPMSGLVLLSAVAALLLWRRSVRTWRVALALQGRAVRPA